MKLECLKDKIQNAISLSERMTGKNLALPVLGTILLSAEGSKLTVRATNLDLGIEVTVPAKIEREGTVAVPGGVISSLLSNIHSDTVIIEVDEHQNLIITTKNTSTRIKSHPHDDFPVLPTVSDENILNIPVEKLITGLKSVWYSASVSDIKPELSSVLIRAEGYELVFAATDSFRLAEKKVKLSDSVLDFSILLPFKNISEIIRVFDGNEDNLVIHYNANQISFKTKDVYLTSRLIDGVFPDYKQIIPSEFSSEVVVLKQDFLNAIKITNLFSDKFNKITLDVDIEGKKFEVYSNNSDVGDNKTNIDTALSGESIALNFNYKYIVDSFQSLTQDSLTLQFSGARLMIIRSIGDPSFMYLVMPLNQ